MPLFRTMFMKRLAATINGEEEVVPPTPTQNKEFMYETGVEGYPSSQFFHEGKLVSCGPLVEGEDLAQKWRDVMKTAGLDNVFEVEPRSLYEIQIDLDMAKVNKGWKLPSAKKIEEDYKINVQSMRYWRSKNGKNWHIVLTVTNALSDMEASAIAEQLGSDPLREDLCRLRLASLETKNTWLLFRPIPSGLNEVGHVRQIPLERMETFDPYNEFKVMCKKCDMLCYSKIREICLNVKCPLNPSFSII